MAIAVGASFGRVVTVFVPVSAKQLTAGTTAQPHKVYPGIKGRVVNIIAQPGTIVASTANTDLDLDVRKGTTLLHSVTIPVSNSSTVATTEAVLSPTLVAAAATRALAVDDYLSCDLVVTGGSTFTFDGIGALVYIARE